MYNGILSILASFLIGQVAIFHDYTLTTKIAFITVVTIVVIMSLRDEDEKEETERED